MRYGWSEGAPCEGRTDLFFASDDETQRSRTRRERYAKEICAACHCIDRCLQEAVDHGERGIWGGMTEKERQMRPLSATSAEVRIAPPARRDRDIDTSGWRVLQRRRSMSGREVRLSICESGETWHGFQYAVHQDDDLAFLADNEPDAWLYFHSLVMS